MTTTIIKSNNSASADGAGNTAGSTTGNANAGANDNAGGRINLMAEIAKSIAEGVFIPSVLAAELDISSKEVTERLFMMDRMGFIAKDSPSSGGCGCAKCCCGCNISECGSAVAGASYVLTEKGRKLLQV
ncbi:MAG: hypothetical protein II893_04380 [Methanomicrobium sp.]|nr:hypothetical protein [Methanomicrobium sp.]